LKKAVGVRDIQRKKLIYWRYIEGTVGNRDEGDGKRKAGVTV
jgi:hypothetical protein